MLLEKLESNNSRITELNTVIIGQKTKIEDLNNKIGILDDRKNTKYATQASQTTDGRQIGKVLQSKNSLNSGSQASSDVTNSILYQIAEETAALLTPFKKNKEQNVTSPQPAPTNESTKTSNNQAKTQEKKQPVSKTTTPGKTYDKNVKTTSNSKVIETGKTEKVPTKKTDLPK